ncbi:hypothetical protein L6164_018536 [Bauhinia variegata]|uniref:Uncharacterized protein n=1 Tax=Bauhinia variegata TaxID=167791 RepID=A0ACB9NGC3_BAUVA|nr:hypothetical protein L6164_018536 [Bauhinia variegata]
MVVSEAKPWKRKMVIMVAVAVPLVLLILFTFTYLYQTRRKFREKEDQSRQEDMEDLPFFDFLTIANATNGFTKKLGEGGFGPVYKGTLVDGQEIAILAWPKCVEEIKLKETQVKWLVLMVTWHLNMLLMLNLISHAWRLWKEGNVFELIDDCLRHSITVSEVLRCASNTGLLRGSMFMLPCKKLIFGEQILIWYFANDGGEKLLATNL